MTEMTRVPLQPIKKGSLTKLWLGVVVAILLRLFMERTGIARVSELVA